MTTTGVNVSELSQQQQISPVAGKKTVTRDDFLKLLTVQLKYQDPLKPMDNTEFTSQMAQFSSLEELTNINDQLKVMITRENKQNGINSINYLDKEVRAKGGEMELKNGEVAKVNFDLSEAAAQVGVNIYDSNGHSVRTILEGVKEAGLQSIIWDGKGGKGERMPDGVYKFDVFARTSEGESIGVTGIIQGKVSGVKIKDGESYLMVGDIELPASEIEEIKQKTGGN